MTYELLSGLAIFALVSSITPGPNNLMLMASGANFGLRRTVPHMLGVSLGFGFMVVLVGVGLAQIFNNYPQSYSILKVASVSYLLYLSWKIATAAPLETTSGDSGQGGRPFSFFQAALFQWVNPKAWTMALTAISVYSPAQNLAQIAMVAAVFSSINLPCIGIWTTLGRQARSLLTSPRRLRTFNIIMAVLLVCSLYPVLTTDLFG